MNLKITDDDIAKLYISRSPFISSKYIHKARSFEDLESSINLSDCFSGAEIKYNNTTFRGIKLLERNTQNIIKIMYEVDKLSSIENYKENSLELFKKEQEKLEEFSLIMDEEINSYLDKVSEYKEFVVLGKREDLKSLPETDKLRKLELDALQNSYKFILIESGEFNSSADILCFGSRKVAVTKDKILTLSLFSKNFVSERLMFFKK